MIVKVILTFLLFSHADHVSSSNSKEPKPNIVVIMVDDMGYQDVSLRGSLEIPTPNIDALAYNGVTLNRFYTPPLCTPSRSSLMTGKYPISVGMQNFVITSNEPFGLPLNEKIMPQYFKEVGYKTHMIGKWHLGFYQQQYAPTRRGFDTFFGYLGPYIDYWSYTLFMLDRNYSRGYDLRRNLEITREFNNVYATDMFTKEAVNTIKKHDKKSPMFMLLSHLAPHTANEDDPMQAPEEEIQKFSYIENKKRRTLAAMMSSLDRGIGKVVSALKDSDMLKNTVIVLYSDNGGPTIGLHSTNASNYPLRGQKHSGWEGAIRTNAIVFTPNLIQRGVVRDQYVHVADLLPTLGSLAGVSFKKEMNLNGINQWPVINEGKKALRDEIVHIDEVFKFGSIIKGQYKIVNGTTGDGSTDGWLSSFGGRSNIDFDTYVDRVVQSDVSKAIRSLDSIFIQPFRGVLTKRKILSIQKQMSVKCTTNPTKKPCKILSAPCLFNIIEDPCEQNNLAESEPIIMKKMLSLFDDWLHKVVPSVRQKADPACDPANFGMTWNWWQKDSII